jgi:hypothetical protein
VPEHAGVEWHVLDLESVTKCVHVEETRMFLIYTPQEPAVARAHIYRRIHDAHHGQVGLRPIHGLGDKQLLSGRDERNANPAHLGNLARPRPSGVDDNRRKNGAFVSVDARDFAVVDKDPRDSGMRAQRRPARFSASRETDGDL